MCPVEVKEKKATKILKTDEHPRPQSNPEQLAKLSPVFKKNGATNQILLLSKCVYFVGSCVVLFLCCFCVVVCYAFVIAFVFVFVFVCLCLFVCVCAGVFVCICGCVVFCLCCLAVSCPVMCYVVCVFFYLYFCLCVCVCLCVCIHQHKYFHVLALDHSSCNGMTSFQNLLKQEP
jgi:hypothetical protein